MLAVVWTALAVYGSLVPLHYSQLDFAQAIERFRQIPYLRLGIDSRSDWVANLLLFIPIGFTWTATFLVDRRGLLRAFVTAVIVVACSIAASVAIEFTQIWFPPRTVSQNDIYAEAIGGLTGIFLWFILGQRLTNWLRSYSAAHSANQQLDWLLQAYFLGLVVYSVLPFDLTIRPEEIFRKYREGKIVLVNPIFRHGITLGTIYEIVTDSLVFLPVGALVATAFKSTHQSIRPMGQCLVIGLMVTSILEGVQLFVYSRFTDASDLVTGTLGVCIGAWLTARWRSQRHETASVDNAKFGWMWLALAVVYSMVLCAVFLSPFDVTHDKHLIKQRLEGVLRVPFSALYAGTDFNAMNQVLRKALWYAPLGALLAMSVSKLRTRVMPFIFCFSVAFGVAVFIELGKVLIPSRIADLTNVVLEAFGFTVGIIITARITKSLTRVNATTPFEPHAICGSNLPSRSPEIHPANE